MIVWAVANQKGGVGKTTTAVTLGGVIAQSGKRVLLVDTDPQASLTYYFGMNSEELSASVYDVFVPDGDLSKEKVLDCLCSSKLDSLFILPATMALATLDKQMGQQSGMGLILKKALDMVADEFDYVLIDSPPLLGVLMINALAASQRIIVPVQTEFLALKGLDRMMHTLEIMNKTQQREFKYLIVPTMYDKRVNAAAEAYDTLKREYPNNLWSDVIPVDTRFRDASQAQMPPSMFCQHSRGVFAYQALFKHLDKLERTV